METNTLRGKSRKRRHSSGDEDRAAAPSGSPSMKRMTFFGRVVESLKDAATPSWLGNVWGRITPTENTQLLPKDTSNTNKQGHDNHGYNATGDGSATTSSLPGAVNGHATANSRSYERTPATAAQVVHTFTSQQTSVESHRQTSSTAPCNEPSQGAFHSIGTPKNRPNGSYSTPASLWQTPSYIHNESNSMKKTTSFNISSFAKTFNDSMDSSMANSSSLGNSSFYKGKTVFGGLSSKRTLNMPAPTPYKRVTRQVKAADDPAKGTLQSVSKTAKAIMSVIDKTGTEADPLNVAQNLPQLFNPGVYLRRKDLLTERKVRTQPPLDKIVKSSKAKITPNHHRQEAKQPATSPSPAASPSYVNVAAVKNQAHSGRGGGKMKTPRTRHRANQSLDSSKTFTGSMVGVNISSTDSSSQYDFRPPAFASSTAPVEPVSPTLGLFTFASPSRMNRKNEGEVERVSNTVAGESDEDSEVEPDSHLGYSTDSLMIVKPLSASTIIATPLNSGEDVVPSTEEKGPGEKTGTDGWKGVFAAAVDKWSCTVCLIQNDKEKEKCVACGTTKPIQVTGDSKPAPASNWGDIFQKPAGQWSCSVCMVSNSADKTSCAACGTDKPADKPAAASKPVDVSQQSKSASASSGWGDLFQKQAGQWNCNACLVSNSVDKMSCAACGTNKPADKPAAAAVGEKTGTDGWKGVFAAAVDKWSCTVCLIQNDKEKEKCVACGTTKPIQVTGDSKPAPASNWGDIFQKPAGEWNCEACLVSNPSDKMTCAACNSSKPGQSTASGTNVSLQPKPSEGNMPIRLGSWTCDMCHATSTMNNSMCTSCGAYKPGFQSSLGDLDKGGPTLPIYTDKQPPEQQTISSDSKSNGASSKPMAGGFPPFSFMKSKPVSTEESASTQSTSISATAGFPISSLMKSQQTTAASETGSGASKGDKPVIGGFPAFSFKTVQPADQSVEPSAKIAIPSSSDSSTPLSAPQAEKTTATISAPATSFPSVMSVFGPKPTEKSSLFQGFGSQPSSNDNKVPVSSVSTTNGQDDSGHNKKPLFSFGMQSKTNTTESTPASVFDGSDKKKSVISTGFGASSGVFGNLSTSAAASKIGNFSFGLSQTSKPETTESSPASAAFGGAQSASGFSFGGMNFGASQASSAFGGSQAASTSKESQPSIAFGGTPLFTAMSKSQNSTSDVGSSSTPSFGGQQLFPQPGNSSTNPGSSAPTGSLFGAAAGFSNLSKKCGGEVFSSENAQPGGKTATPFQFGASTNMPVFGSPAVAPVFGGSATAAPPAASGNEPAAFGSAVGSAISSGMGASSFGDTPGNGSNSSNPSDASGKRVFKKAARRIKK